MQQLNLLELVLIYDKALEDLTADDGIAVMEKVNQAEKDLSLKVDDWAYFLRTLEKEYKDAEERTAAYRKKREALKNTLAKAKEWLKIVMENGPQVPYKGSKATLRLQANGGKKALDLMFNLGEKTVANIVDHFSIDLVPDEYLKPVSFYTLDTEKLREDLEKGKELPFAKLVQGKHVRVTV